MDITIDIFAVGQVWMTKKGHKMEIMEVHHDYDGRVLVRLYVHRDSQNITPKDGTKGYGWKHNTKYFMEWIRIEGKNGMQHRIDSRGFKLK
jgi:hypothetical protein